ncbi:unnamed protein product [Symbiodinium necroappetens]|uniref:C3H1-type domain-containing protein n=1 Tax=Symbiodinium necroappetens TaxID=1628268 RepID=A0A812ZJC5_9DINO|nr:unnamed protein product [Symbiodinium necroappetens]
MGKRMLCIFSVWKVKSLQHQLLSSVKKRKLAPNLYTEDDDPDEAGPRDANSYLDRLFTLCLACAMAGTMAVPAAPAAMEEASLGADSTLFVAVPVDVVMMYWFRAKRTAALVTATHRLSWLQARDQEERTEWVARFRDSQKTLGQVIKEVYVARDPHWIPVSSSTSVGSSSQLQAPPPPPKVESLFQILGTIAGKKVAARMKDGKQLCGEFQRGKCNKKDCTSGAHLCGVVIRHERVCGGQHTPAQCKNKVKPRHNIDEIASGPPSLCQHFHDPSEWDPYWVGGELRFPSQEEAQVTAPLAFFIAVSASWWAARRGLAVVRIHRLPPVEITGRREPRGAIRSVAMAPLAISLGLRPGAALTRCADFVAAELWHDLGELAGLTLLSDTAMEAIGQAVPVPFQQEAVILRFRKLWFQGFRFPMVEDLLNQAPFDTFCRWLAPRSDEWEGPLVPVAPQRQQRFRQRTADGLQIGASTHRAALPPLSPFGLQLLPTELHPVLDPDLLFAAEVNAKRRGALRPMRQRAVGALKELKRRWGPVGARLRARQPQALRRATQQRDLGFEALIILASWGDVTYAHGLVKGLPAVGFAPPYGVSLSRPGRLDQVLLEQSLADAAQGFCSEPLSQAGVQRLLKGGQSATSADSNKPVLCSPLRPARHLRATISYMSEADFAAARAEDSWQTGGEDWPNAYRHSPMSSEESRACVVCFWHDEWQQPAFQVYAGLLFGLPLAVTSFNRYSRLVEALGRRLVLTMVSLYFDDATVGDWASSKGSGQWAFGQLNALLGTPFAESKRQPMSHRGDFLGLSHDMSRALSDGVVHFWPRDRSSRQALRHPYNFFEQGVYGKVGAGSLWAIKERQYEAATQITPDILGNFRYIRAIIRAKPQRQLPVVPLPCDRFVCASDAAEEPDTGGTGGFLVVWFSGAHQTRQGFVADIHPWWYSVWQSAEVHIAQLEVSMVAYALLGLPDRFRNRRGIWFLDNVASLMALVKGRSSSRDLENFAHMVHMLLLGLNTQMWFEYIPSKSNWADAISRLGRDDPWHVSQSFSTSVIRFPRVVWGLPPSALLTLASFL